MKSHIILYPEDFSYDVWEEYCEICGVHSSATSITIVFNDEDVRAEYGDDYEEDDDEEDASHPCDNGECPFNAEGGYDCRNFCGLGVDEDEEEIFDFDNEEEPPYDYEDRYYTPSSTNGDYSPSNPWDAPGMSINDFI